MDPGPPVRVSYRLTPRGRALSPVIASVDAWAADWMMQASSASVAS